MDGVSLADLVTGKVEKLEPRSLHWFFPAYLQSYGKTVSEQRDPLFRTRPCSIIRKGNWKLHQYFENGDLELYDLSKDIGESNNLAKSAKDKTKELLMEMQRWQKAVDAPTNFRPNKKFDPRKEAAAITSKLKR